MSSSTTASTPATTVPVITNPFTQLTLDELNQLETTIQPTLTTLANGDGSTPALIGAWISIQGAFATNASLFQKIGVNDGASWLANLISTGISDLKAKVSSQS